MKDKLFLFPALILVLTPCVWYSNQPGVDGIQGIDFLLSPGCFLTVAIAAIGCLLRKEAICLIGNLLFIPTMLLFVYRQGQIFEGNNYSVTMLMSGLSPLGNRSNRNRCGRMRCFCCANGTKGMKKVKNRKRTIRRRSEFRRLIRIKFLSDPINPTYTPHPTY